MRLSRKLSSHRGSSSVSTRRCRGSGRVVSRNLPGHCAILGTRSWARGRWKALVKGNQQRTWALYITSNSRTSEGLPVRNTYYFLKPIAQNKEKSKSKTQIAISEVTTEKKQIQRGKLQKSIINILKPFKFSIILNCILLKLCIPFVLYHFRTYNFYI